MQKAFSLIELLISLIIISLITSAFAPVMTKRLTRGEITLSNKSTIASDCSNFNKCLLCDSKKCILCQTQIDTIDGYYSSPELSCEYKECPSNCVVCNDKGCLKCIEGYTLVNGGCFSCTSSGAICAANFNAGDSGGLEIPPDVEIKTTSSTSITTTSACWKGRTALNCDSSGGSYSGCTRTVCTWEAADRICKYNGWRLPTLEELAGFGALSINKGNNGLQLCDHYSGYKSSVCENSNYCKGSRDNGCAPDALWSSTQGRDYYLHKGVWGGPYSENPLFGFSVRCVKDL